MGDIVVDDTLGAERLPQYNEALRAPIQTLTGATPHADVHRSEFEKVINGAPRAPPSPHTSAQSRIPFAFLTSKRCFLFGRQVTRSK